MSEELLLSPETRHQSEPYPQIIPEAEQQLSEVDQLNTFIRERTGEALKTCEFQETPELREAIHGFYHDHYYLAGAIKASVEGRYDAELFDAILADPATENWEKEIGSQFPLNSKDREHKSPNARVAAYRLADMAKDINVTKSGLSDVEIAEKHFNLLRQCGLALQESLFLESSVGISTLGEGEVKLAGELADGVKVAVGNRYIWDAPAGRVSFATADDVTNLIREQQERFWGDTRHAGQLEFHGSGNLGGINVLGLMSRNQQVRKTGKMRTQTVVNFGGGTMHSIVPHFSEFYGNGGYVLGESGGTVAVPLIKIIDQAPYARDAEYAALIPKATDTDEKVPQPILKHATGIVGAGGNDTVGAGGLDRVFFSSPDETSDKLPDDYEVNLFDKANKPATYIVDRKLHDHNPERELRNLGIGYGFPERFVIEPGDDTEEKIRNLQAEYLEAYAHRGIIVPLRRGVFAHSFENMPVGQVKGRRGPRIYNQYVPGSELNVA